MTVFSDARIIEAWHNSASPWTTAVRDGRIESRRLVTDRAVIEAVLEHTLRSVLDIGCGEGWLARALATHGIDVTGVDVVDELIAQARAAGGGDFRVMSYEQIAAGALQLKADAVVCNFSLLGKESVEGVVAAVPSLLDAGGRLIVQTLHPVAACGDALYRDGWREGSWAGFGSEFTDPAPWYFRTLESWAGLFAANGMRLLQTREPVHPETGRPASVIFVAQPVAGR